MERRGSFLWSLPAVVARIGVEDQQVAQALDAAGDMAYLTGVAYAGVVPLTEQELGDTR